MSNSALAGGSFIGGGSANQINLSPANGWGDSTYTVIAGGANNSISAPSANGAQYSVISGGSENSITSDYSTIGGGHNNVAKGLTSTVAGGYANVANGQNGTIPGGASNVAGGRDSFAAGVGSQALNNGAFVWSDYSPSGKTVASTASNQFLARASGGFFFYSSANLSSGVKLAPGSGSWSSLSDRADKTSIESVDDARILAKVAQLAVSEWSYSAQGSSVRHIGPMAQDFRAAFRLGEDDKHISVVDEEGVALAAIKALEAQVTDKDRQIDELQSGRRTDEARFANLERRLDALEGNGRGPK
jgi:hypothetical protein